MASSPKSILIVRHAEKEGDPSRDAASDGIHLSARGRVRAAALSAYIPASLPKIDYLFASRQSPQSNRSSETVTPLAKELGLQIDTRYKDDDYALLAQEILNQAKYANKTVLICWHHGRIPHLAAALGIVKPPAWPGTVFDRVWSIDYAERAPMLHNNPQMLLYGDSST